jgi:UDP:flavonoid glycosyltransferase YjiC (YdhE family)
MLPDSDRELMGMFVKTLESLGLAGIVSAKDRQDGPAALGAHSLLVGELPHSWLFPRLDAAVHHGGAGTTGAVIRAGIPGLVLPVSNDQFFWGRRVAALGLGPEPVPFRRLTVPRLSAALEKMISSRHMQLRAREMGKKVQLENGVQQAVEFIQAYGEHRA